MATDNNVKLLLYICCNVAIFFHLVTSKLSPETSPYPQTHISLSPTLSPSQGPALEPVWSPSPRPSPGPHISFPPTLSPSRGPTQGPVLSPAPGPIPVSHVSYPPSISISPTVEGPSAFDYLLNFDISPTPSSFDDNPLVKEICESTDYPSLCLAIIAPHLDGKPDLPIILEVAVKGGISIARHALLVANQIAENPEDPNMSAILHDCKNVYDDVVHNFENALRAFPKHDIGTMNSMFSLVITDIGDCEDALQA